MTLFLLLGDVLKIAPLMMYYFTHQDPVDYQSEYYFACLIHGLTIVPVACTTIRTTRVR